MRGENRQGRFNIDHERQSIISGTTKELVELTGNMIDWWFFDEDNTVIDPIYDVGSNEVGGGRMWIGPLRLPTVNATIEQGVTIQSDRGFYNTDVLMLTLNMDIIKDSGSLLGANAATRPRLDRIETQPDHYLKDRVVYRGQYLAHVRFTLVDLSQTSTPLLPFSATRSTLKSLLMIHSSRPMLTTILWLRSNAIQVTSPA